MTSAGRGGGGLPTVPRTGCPSLTLGQVRAIIELHQGVFFISGASGQSLILARTGEPGADNPRFLFVPCIRRAGRLHSYTIGTDPVLIEKWRSFREQHFGLRAAAAGDGARNNDRADPAAVDPAPSAIHAGAGGPRRRVGRASCERRAEGEGEGAKKIRARGKSDATKGLEHKSSAESDHIYYIITSAIWFGNLPPKT